MTTTAHTIAPAAPPAPTAITITAHEHGHVLEAHTRNGQLYGRASRSRHQDDEWIGWLVETVDGLTVVATRPDALRELQARAAHATGRLTTCVGAR